MRDKINEVINRLKAPKSSVTYRFKDSSEVYVDDLNFEFIANAKHDLEWLSKYALKLLDENEALQLKVLRLEQINRYKR